MRTKNESVKVSSLQPPIIKALDAVDDIFRRWAGRDAIITSANDGRHSHKSKHYAGLAVDLRTKDLPNTETKLEVLRGLKKYLGAPFDIIIEDMGGNNEHIHIEFDPVRGEYK